MAEIVFTPAPGTGGGGGETNTASNLGEGQGLYKQKAAADLQFRSLVDAGNSRITIDTVLDDEDVSLDLTADGVDNTILANMPAYTFKANDTALEADPDDITVADAKTLLDYTASEIDFGSTGDLEATNVQDALEELDVEKSDTGHTHVHNDTTDKQGGTTDEYYHLTASQHDLLTDEGDVDDADSMHTHDGKADVVHDHDNFDDLNDGFAPASGGGTTKYLRADATWQVPPDTGEVNTGSDLGGTAGTFKQKTGVDLEFRGISDGGSSHITVTENATDIGLSITAGAVDTTELANDAVTNDKIADDAVDTDQLADNAVNEARIANDAVTYAKIQDVTATDRILGRKTAGSGIVEELEGSDVGGMHSITDHSDIVDATGANIEELTAGGDTSLHTHDYAPSDAQYLVKVADADLSNEWVIFPVLPMTYNDTTTAGVYYIGFSITTLDGVSVTYTPDETDTLCINDVSDPDQPANYKITVAELRKPLVETYTALTIDTSNETEPDFDDGFKFELVLDDDCEVQMPLNPAEGYMMELRVIQDGGSNALTFESGKFNEGEITDITADQTDGNVTYYLFKYNENSGDMDIVAVNRGYPNA
jgi:hypothetical protein